MSSQNGIARSVLVQFSFTNPELIPSSLRRLTPETKKEHEERKSHTDGLMVIEPTEKSCVKNLLEDLESSGYELVDSAYKTRLDMKKKKTYHMIRFLFVLKEFAYPAPLFLKRKASVRFALVAICRDMWRVRSFSNPYYIHGEEIEGYRAVSINMEARMPYFEADGKPVTVWKKDEYGERVGEAPELVTPDHILRVFYSALLLTTLNPKA